MGVENIEIDTLRLRIVARTLPGKQCKVGRELRGDGSRTPTPSVFKPCRRPSAGYEPHPDHLTATVADRYTDVNFFLKPSNGLTAAGGTVTGAVAASEKRRAVVAHGQNVWSRRHWLIEPDRVAAARGWASSDRVTPVPGG
jgi:hypothetical protein